MALSGSLVVPLLLKFFILFYFIPMKEKKFFFYGVWDNSCSSSEGWSLLVSIFNGHVSFFNYQKFFECLHEEKTNEFSSSMCQHDVRSERS